jgi:hypothetical protein
MRYDDLIPAAELERAALYECGFGVCARNPECKDLHCPGRAEAREQMHASPVEFAGHEPLFTPAAWCAVGVMLAVIFVCVVAS